MAAAAVAESSSRSSTSADSYIGSLISLTSKSEIRYEGVLYNINTEESSIGLRNVRSFGTEGRKKDGPQVPTSDKVYEYILFRGSDIKDLQVKSSPPVQSALPINSDPAIIQSHYPRPAATSTSLPAAASGSLTDLSPPTAQLAHPGSIFQGGLPLYQPGGSLGSWGPSPPPNANGGGLAMPVYWQGFYGSPNGLPQLSQQSLLQPPPGLSMPPSMHQPMQFSSFSASLPTGAYTLPGSNLPEYPSSLVPTINSSFNLTSSTLPPSTLPSTMPPVPPVMLSSETLPSMMPNKASSSAVPTTTLNAKLPPVFPLTTTSSPEVNSILPPIYNMPNAVPGPPTVMRTSSSIQAETPTPSLVTLGQLQPSGFAVVSSSQSSKMADKDLEVVQVSASPSSEPLVPVPAENQPPILPTPPVSHAQKISRPVTKFTEDFDFMAMNEKFKKDEVWGHLGKSNKFPSNNNGGDGQGSDEDDLQDEYDSELPKFEIKPVYNKDDFFDSLSCTALDNDSNNGRTRFSEQLKIDTETFGEFSRYRGGRGGHGPGRGGGRSRGSYYGRGYASVGRGRGRGSSYRGY
ncbi:unnamed protein product [Ilex paraguariensis]|uniref:Protein decapping 5 n=1 Tax=Ilex paraguariensis TaxID=185542 RepID=A0ABC8V4S2_9AQUA